MASITIRNLDSRINNRLRVRATQKGHSMEHEAREILRMALRRGKSGPTNLAHCIRARFDPLGGVELPKIERDAIHDPHDPVEFMA